MKIKCGVFFMCACDNDPVWLAVVESLECFTKNVQFILSKVGIWTKKWRIKLKVLKWIHVMGSHLWYVVVYLSNSNLVHSKRSCLDGRVISMRKILLQKRTQKYRVNRRSLLEDCISKQVYRNRAYPGQ